jgi:hypothetical protein
VKFSGSFFALISSGGTLMVTEEEDTSMVRPVSCSISCSNNALTLSCVVVMAVMWGVRNTRARVGV